MQKIIELQDQQATQRLAKQLSQLVQQPFVVYLYGNLGAGKTTLVRYFIESLNHRGLVKSPTYTLVENYQLAGLTIYHFDLYRLANSEELEFIGIRDYFINPAVHFIEWPERGEKFLPTADLNITLEWLTETKRIAKLKANTERGIKLLTGING